jgi:murein peptide amidase A
VVDLSGGNPGIERGFASRVGLPFRRLKRYPGSATGWENHADPTATAFVVELPAGTLSSGATARYANAILTLAHRIEKSDLRS